MWIRTQGLLFAFLFPFENIVLCHAAFRSQFLLAFLLCIVIVNIFPLITSSSFPSRLSILTKVSIFLSLFQSDSLTTFYLAFSIHFISSAQFPEVIIET